MAWTGENRWSEHVAHVDRTNRGTPGVNGVLTPSVVLETWPSPCSYCCLDPLVASPYPQGLRAWPPVTDCYSGHLIAEEAYLGPTSGHQGKLDPRSAPRSSRTKGQGAPGNLHVYVHIYCIQCTYALCTPVACACLGTHEHMHAHVHCQHVCPHMHTGQEVYLHVCTHPYVPLSTGFPH